MTETIGTELHVDPNWSRLPPQTPPTVRLLLRKCLARDRRRRLQDIGNARIDLEEAIADPDTSPIRLGEESLRERDGRKWFRRPVGGRTRTPAPAG